jgi:serine protease Do
VLEAIQNQNRYVAQQVLPVVVEVNVVDIIQQNTQAISPFSFFFGPQGNNTQPREFRQQGLGSGVIVARDNDTVYVITNNHVVDGADEIGITLHDGRNFSADVVGTDSRTDLALISFKTSDDVPVAVLGNSSDLMVGDFVFAVGNPLGFDATVTSGIISALGRQSSDGQSATDYIQTDAAINQGNSGGALVNLYGEVVGINSWIASNSGGNIGLGFAIPVDTVKTAIKDFIESGAVQYGWLGVSVGTPSDQTKQEMGLNDANGGFVYNVVKGSPADQAGLLPGDFITRIGDTTVKDANQLTMVVGNLKPGQTEQFSLERLGKQASVDVTIGLRDEATVTAGTNVWPGMTVVTLNDSMRQQAGLPKDAGNIVVGAVEPNSPAAVAGIQAGDIIRSIDGSSLNNIRDFYSTLNSAKQNHIDFSIFRQGTVITIGLASS